LIDAIVTSKDALNVREVPNTVTNRELEDLSVILWRKVYQTYSRFKNGADQTLAGYGLTMEQYLLLVTIKSYGSAMRITDIAGWLERSTNSISMLVDRMVRAGLLRRVRDRSDRRVVNASLTSKAENALELANPAFWEFLQQTMSPLSYKDRHTLASLLDPMNCKLLEYLNPGADVEGMLKTDAKQHKNRLKEWRRQPFLSTPEAKRSSSKKEGASLKQKRKNKQY
jgi:DNA-binding MarR family transcriptional regulator